MATRTESMPDVRLQERKSFAVLRDLCGRQAHGGTTGGEGRTWGINSPADVIRLERGIGEGKIYFL